MTQLEKENLSLSWLKNGIYALAIAGIYSIILVLIRAPQTAIFFSNKEFFKAALVVHVDLSVLVWLMSITAFFWSYGQLVHKINIIFAKIALSGTALIAISPFVGESVAIMNNYIPMLDNLCFVVGLSLFSTSILCFAIFTAIFSLKDAFTSAEDASRLLAIAKLTSALLLIISWIFFAISLISINKFFDNISFDPELYYELLYWSGGHLLQFLYTQIAMLAWLLLFEIWLSKNFNSMKLYSFLLILNFMLALVSIYGHIKYDVMDDGFKEFFTMHMKYAGGIAPSLFIFALFSELLISKTNNFFPSFAKASIISSIFLFLFGGVVAMMISGSNVTIPAHYHGSIVGISLAFMGVAYIFFYKEGLFMQMIETKRSQHNSLLKILIRSKPEDLANSSYSNKLTSSASWQMYILMIGQLLHIAGLALAGGYGVMRKQPYAEMTAQAKIYMAMVGGGGIIAIVGGLMFVYICTRMVIIYSPSVKMHNY